MTPLKGTVVDVKKRAPLVWRGGTSVQDGVIYL